MWSFPSLRGNSWACSCYNSTATIPLVTSFHTALPSTLTPTLLHPPAGPPVATISQTPSHLTAERGDLATHGFFERGTNTIINICISNIDCATSWVRDPIKVLQQHEADKRRKYQAICASQQVSFHPFVASADGLLAPAATWLLKHLAALTADQNKIPILLWWNTLDCLSPSRLSRLSITVYGDPAKNAFSQPPDSLPPI